MPEKIKITKKKKIEKPKKTIKISKKKIIGSIRPQSHKVSKKESIIIKNKSNYDIKNLLNLKKTDCTYYLKKDGDVIRFSKKLDIYYQAILCILNNNDEYNLIYFPYLYGNNETLLKKLVIIDYLQKNNYKYILKNKFDNKSLYPDMEIYLFNIKNIDKIAINLFIPYIKEYDIKLFKEMYPENETKEDNIIRYLGAMALIQKTKNMNQTDDEILVFIFFKNYIFLIQDELIKKYGMTLESFKNYKQLYQFLECNGYVNKYYNKIGSKIIKRMNEFMEKIQNHPLFIPFKDNLLKYEVKELNTLSIYDLIQEYVPTYIDKNKLWNKFKLLKKIDGF